MNIGKTSAIFHEIESDKYTLNEKCWAVYQILKMPTHNGFTKAAIIKACLYVFEGLYKEVRNNGA